MWTPLTEPTIRLPDYEDVRRAAKRLEGVAHRTPVLTSRIANERTGGELFFKCENFQRAGAFKFRGAYNAIAALNEDQRRRGVVAFSSGNHGQAIALAGRLQGAPVTIVMPKDAPTVKVAATRGYGAEVVFYDRFLEDREAITRYLAHDRGLALVPPFDHPDVIAGQGTAAKELIEDVGPLDVLVVCLGGGGLLAGCALSIEVLSPGATIVGVEPEAGNDGQRSLRSGEIVHIRVPTSIADGALTQHLGQHTFPIIQRLVADIVTVTDDELVATMRFFAERMKIIVEPTGCLGAAAVLNGTVSIAGKRTGVLISGGNVDLGAFSRLILGNPGL
jgi:threo-3-hydroxy-L-aspartate ammonia-lyase